MPAKKKPSRMNARLDWLTKTRSSSAVVITGKAEKKSSRDKESNCQHFARKIASCLTGNDYFKEKPHCCSKTFLCRVFAELLVSKETWGVVLGS